MSKMIQVRNVPDSIHRVLKVRAAQAGMSLSDYLLKELSHIAALPTMEEWLERVRALPPVKVSVDSAKIIRELRGPLPR